LLRDGVREAPSGQGTADRMTDAHGWRKRGRPWWPAAFVRQDGAVTEEEDIAQCAARTLTYQPVQVTGWLAAGGLLLAGLAWLVRGVWEIRLAVAGEPAAGPPDQGNGVHRPLNSLEDSYHLVSSAGGVLVFLCAVLFLSWLLRLRDNARVLS